MIEGKGTLRYSSTFEEMKWWLVVDCDKEIGKYYRNLYYLLHHKCRELQRPAWESHISVIRNEEPPKKDLWGKYNGLNITYQYNPVIRNNGIYFWLDVECNQLLDIREEIGLDREPYFPLHLTVANAKAINEHVQQSIP